MNVQDNNGFLIGALLRIPSEQLGVEIQAMRMQDPQFADVRPIHDPVFIYLPAEGCRITELAERANTTRQAMTYLVDYLVERGYLERVDDPTDKRAQIIRLTQKGWDFHLRSKQHVAEVQKNWGQQLGEQDMQTLMDLLRRLVHDVLEIEYKGSLSR